MKKPYPWEGIHSLFVLVAVLPLFAGSLSQRNALAGESGTASAGIESVMVEAAALRKAPAVFADAVVVLGYGTVVDRLEQQGAWVRVRARSDDELDVEGWLKAGELAPGSPTLGGGGSKPVANTPRRSVSLAGKGLLSAPTGGARDLGTDAEQALETVEGYQSLLTDPGRARRFLDRGRPGSGQQ